MYPSLETDNAKRSCIYSRQVTVVHSYARDHKHRLYRINIAHVRAFKQDTEQKKIAIEPVNQAQTALLNKIDDDDDDNHNNNNGAERIDTPWVSSFFEFVLECVARHIGRHSQSLYVLFSSFKYTLLLLAHTILESVRVRMYDRSVCN